MKHQRISEFSSSLGVSHTAIRKAINSGRIPADLVRTKTLPTGRKVAIIIDACAARAAFLANRCSGVLDDEVTDSAGDIPTRDACRVWDVEVAQLIHEEYLFAHKVLMDIPARVAESVAAACTDAKQIHAILEGAISDALDDLMSDIDHYYASGISDIEPETSTPIQFTCLP